MILGQRAQSYFPLGSKEPLTPGSAVLPVTSSTARRPGELERPVTDLTGVGRRTAERLSALGLESIGDLLFHVPFRYEVAADLVDIGSLREGRPVSVRGRVQSVSVRRTRRPGLKVLEAIIGDGTGSVRAVWYNQQYLEEPFSHRPEVLLRGSLVRRGADCSFRIKSHEILSGGPDEGDGIHTLGPVPVYPATGELSVRLIRSLLHRALPYAAHLIDPVPARILAAEGMPSSAEAVATVHFPGIAAEGRAARNRLAFEELLLLQVALLLRRRREQSATRARPLPPAAGQSQRLFERLAFVPTAAQRRSLDEIDGDLAKPVPMRRLLQGDVGSGKTLVATYALLRAVEAGGQAALMAPTEVLAEQHAARLGPQLADLGVRLALLTGSCSAAERRALLAGVAGGEIQVLVGTHALIQEAVRFRDLLVAVVDEQHRFGVRQREALAGAGGQDAAPHVLHMTATPIPRTLSLTVYGDLDVSVIDELPPGRTPVKTWVVPDERTAGMWEFVRGELDAGRQAYIVCPLIEESDALCVASARSVFTELSAGPLAGYRLGLLHGKLASAEKQRVMNDFQEGGLQALVSTSVIEVGVDVANASVMVIQGAHRFGLSQLHQLRGRVGRGTAESYCLLLPGGGDEDAQKRLKLFAKTSDGFALAEADLRLRGEGQLFGSRQSGMGDLRIARLLTDGKLLYRARRWALALLGEDLDLVRPEHRMLRDAAEARFGAITGWLDRV